MAYGFGTYGKDTGFDPARSVQRSAMPQSLASRLHYQEGRSAKDLYDMSDADWEDLTKNIVSRDEVADYMRAYEHYQ